MAHKKRSFDEIVELASREVETTAVWRSLSIDDREKALRRLLGLNWRDKKQHAIAKWQRQLS